MKKYSQLVKHEGNIPLFKMIDLSITGAMNNVPVHIHAEGLRGTGKTTIMRSVKDILPKIERIKGCSYNCDPKRPHCPEHSNLSRNEIKTIGTEFIQMPFLEISPSAKKGTIVGSIDLKKLTHVKKPEAALLLGTIPKAHRGIIFIDEINRVTDIAPEIADILLDVMGTKPGRIQIEESGLSVINMPVQVCVWAASNPDEDPGPLEDIRKQLSDRFDFCIDVKRPKDIDVVMKILEGSVAENKKDIVFNKTRELANSADDLELYKPKNEILKFLSSLYVDFDLESLRTVESIILGLKLKGALTKKSSTFDDLLFISRYALLHRTDNENLNNILLSLDNIKNKNFKTKSVKNTRQNKANTDKSISKQKVEQKDTNLLRKIVSFISNLFNKKDKKQGIDSIKAPPEKAYPLKKLHFKEYVKNEEELR